MRGEASREGRLRRAIPSVPMSGRQLLLPAALQEWLPLDHLACFISDFANQLDLPAITARHEEQRCGPPYHPRMMVKALLYAHCTGVASSRHKPPAAPTCYGRPTGVRGLELPAFSLH